MKTKNIKWIMAVLVAVAMIACKKKDDVSTVVHVPKIELLGNAVYSTPVGTGTYADPGAIFTDEDGNSTTLTTPTTGTVDLATPAFYTVRYEQKTPSGYTVYASRLVLVTSLSPALDYSGTYYRNTNGQAVNITKLGTGLYKTDNVGGVAGNPGFIFDVFFGQVDDSTLIVPLQASPLGDIECTNGNVFVVGPDTTIQWKVINSSFGTSLRKFIK